MSMTDQQLEYQQRTARIFQARYDDALREVGIRAPEPILGQDPYNYRRKALHTFQCNHIPQNHELAKIDPYKLPAETLDIFEPKIINAAITELTNPTTVPPGELRQVDKFDRLGRVCEHNFYGESFVKQMGRPGRRVTSFRTEQGFWDASGRPLR